MKKVFYCVLFLALTLYSLPARAQSIPENLAAIKPKNFPVKPIELVVTYPAGGGMDVTARILAKHLEKYVGTRCIVVNKTGGAGRVGDRYLAKEAPKDGYTVAILANTILADEIFHAKGEWSYKDIPLINYINFSPINWIVNTKGKFAKSSIKEVIEYARSKPDEVLVSMVPDNIFDFLPQLVGKQEGVKFKRVPFQGGNPGIVAMLGGHIDVSNAFIGESISHLQAGTARAIATAHFQRYSYLPDVPTFNEALGKKNYIMGAWRYAALPKGVSPDIQKFLEAAINMTLRDKELIADYDKVGVDMGRYLTREEASQELDKLYDMEIEMQKTLGNL